MTWVLASTSPRRKELLTQAGFSFPGFSFELVAPDIDETQADGEMPLDFVARLAIEKAQTGLTLAKKFTHPRVLGSDTIVVIDGKVLGKPQDKADAMQMLMQLSGRTHQVMTAVALTDGSQTLSRTCVTEVTFCELTQAEITAYIDTGEPMDKAGSYGIQAIGGCFVERINGSYSAVVGLPLVETRELLKLI
ncbi:septum formation inhibitor Maf [Shewanella sp. WXL01]|uniref:Maf family protein n=1 Tax=Shewanella sp. WXL01 TaxID=2709721 RepID=UPI00169BB10A|nr:Maf family protein [Shewanella sp. WXL01]NKF49084.1 septum formation inhibitor Maf [Shewanella sp. WXL01]